MLKALLNRRHTLSTHRRGYGGELGGGVISLLGPTRVMLKGREEQPRVLALAQLSPNAPWDPVGCGPSGCPIVTVLPSLPGQLCDPLGL